MERYEWKPALLIILHLWSHMLKCSVIQEIILSLISGISVSYPCAPYISQKVCMCVPLSSSFSFAQEEEDWHPCLGSFIVAIYRDWEEAAATSTSERPEECVQGWIVRLGVDQCSFHKLSLIKHVSMLVSRCRYYSIQRHRSWITISLGVKLPLSNELPSPLTH